MAIPLLISFLSGLASFLHESVWIRSLGFVLGNSSISATVVLSAFVGGLGLGGLYFPSRIRNPRWGYALLQGSVAVLGAVLPVLALRLPLWPGGAGDFFLAFAAVFFPAFLIGGSFPLLFALIASNVSRREAAWMYGVNAAGAMLGAAIGPYLGAVLLGLQGAGWAASAINLGNAILVATLLRGEVSSPLPEPVAQDRVGSERAASWALFVVGFVTMGFQILMARALMFYFKGFALVYAFVIATFLLGLSVGSFCVARRKPARSSERAMGVALLFVAAGCVLPLAISAPIGGASSFWLSGSESFFYWRLFGVTALFSLPATVALGACIPLAYEAMGGRADRRAGKAAFWNCFGSLAAPLFVGLFLIQWTSLPMSFVLVAGPAIVLGVLLLWREGTGLSRVLACGAAVPALLLFAPGSFDNFLSKCWIVRSAPHLDILAHRDGRDFGVSVVEDRLLGERTLLTDSFRAAGTHEDFRYMHGLGSLPLLVHPKPEKVCVICFGTGTTAGAVARHAEVKELDIVEIAQEAIDFAPWFSDRNRDLFPGGNLDSRASFLVDDGRRFLRETGKTYDVITLEPLLPVTPVAVHFYTREFYDLVKRRLRPNGVLCQWVPTAVVYAQAYQSLLATFFDSFPDGSLWVLGEVTVLLAGGTTPSAFADAEWRRRPDLAGILARMGFANEEEFLASLIAQGADLSPLFAETEILSDNRPWVEWFGHQTSKDKYVMASQNLGFLVSLQNRSAAPWVSPRGRENKFRFLDARLSAANENLLLQTGTPFPARATLDRLESLVQEGGPSEAERWKRRAAGVVGFREGIVAMRQGRLTDAASLFEWACREDPGNCRPWIGLGAAQLAMGKEREARASLAKAFVLFPRLREGVDWILFSSLLEDPLRSQAVVESETLGRNADRLVLDLRPSWETLAKMAKEGKREDELALWAAGIRLPFEFRRILEEKIEEDRSDSEDVVLAFLADVLHDSDFFLHAAKAWKNSARSSRREHACLFLREVSGKKGLRDLVDLLRDEALPVRRAAITSLFHRTKQSLDYDFAAEAKVRELAIARWVAWIENH